MSDAKLSRTLTEPLNRETKTLVKEIKEAGGVEKWMRKYEKEMAKLRQELKQKLQGFCEVFRLRYKYRNDFLT